MFTQEELSFIEDYLKDYKSTAEEMFKETQKKIDFIEKITSMLSEFKQNLGDDEEISVKVSGEVNNIPIHEHIEQMRNFLSNDIDEYLDELKIINSIIEKCQQMKQQ